MISGNDASRVFQVGTSGGGKTFRFNDLAIANGNADGSGAGGGGIRMVDAGDTLEINRSTIRNNHGNGAGGLALNGTFEIMDTAIINNTANFGGPAMQIGDANGWINNSTISGNSSGAGQGAIEQIGGTGQTTLTRLRNVTIANNTGHGITNATFDGGTATFEISNSIFADNSGANVNNTNQGTTGVSNIVSDGNNISDDGSTGFLAGDQTNTDPLIGALADNGGPTRTHALLAGSPAIDAGTNSDAVDSFANPFLNDQRQGPFRRFYDADNDGTATIDIGAVEYYGELFVSTNTDVEDTDYSAGQFSLREAIAVANAQPGADTITFNSGLNGGTITLGGTELDLTDEVAITGPGADQLTVDADNGSRVFHVGLGVTAELAGLAITGGDADGSVERAFGGSIGGGILNEGGTLTVTASRIFDHSATYGSGINNYAGSGGTATLVVRDSTIDTNSATENGGGVYNWGDGGTAIATVTNTTVSGNSAGTAGAGIYSWTSNASLTLTNSTIAQNVSNLAFGGGVHINGSTATLNNALIIGNTGGGNAADIALEAGSIETSSANNLIGDPGSAGGLVHGTNGNILGDGAGTEIPASSVLNTTLAGNGGPTQTHELVEGSPAIDAGNDALAVAENNDPLTTDQRGAGLSRILDGDDDGTATVDIGAFEAPRMSRLIVVESDDETSVSESVGIDSFSVELNFQPTTDVVVQVTGDDFTEFVLDQATVTFTPENWNLPQTIQVMGIDDREQDGDIATILTIAVDVANSDPEFSETTAHQLTVTTTDNEASTIGLGDSFDNHAPTQVVNYTIALVGLFPSRDGGLGDFEPVIGQIGIVGFNFAPGGSAFADGQVLQISQHTALFSILGTTYGGDGETTFALPDLRGRVPIGADPDNGILLGAEIGSTEVTLTEANLPSHSHTVTGSPVTLEPTGDDQPFDNQQPALALTPIVARQGVFDGLGEVVWFAGNFVPERELPADGSLLPISSNTALFSMLGTTYGGDGETTFGLPDLRGRAAIGAGNGPGLTARSQGQEVGEVSTVVTTANLPSHTHQLEQATVEATGTGTPLDNLHPATTMKYLVALTGIFPSQGGGGAPGRALGGEPFIGQIALTSAAGQIPNGFALADGQLLDIASNTALFSLYGTTYGGDGETTFGLPDLRGRLAAHDDSTHSLGSKHGSETVTLTEATMPAHSHVVIPPEEYIVTTAVDEIDFTNSDVSLREAVISANHHAGQQDITFATALTGSTITLSAGELELTDDATISGLGADNLTVDASGNSRVFRVAAADVTISDIAITGGDANNSTDNDPGWSGLGGGIFNEEGTLTVSGTRIYGNVAAYGAGINNWRGTVTIVGSTFDTNETAGGGAGLYNWGDGGTAMATVTNSTFTGNTNGGDGTITNWAGSSGSATLNATNVTIAQNIGAGIRLYDGPVTLNNSLVLGNSTGDITRGSLEAASANNLIGAPASAGGLVHGTDGNILGDGAGNAVAAATVIDTILADNGGPTQTHALVTGSPAIDAGNTSSLATDQRGSGFDRVADGDGNGSSIVDIGAFEVAVPVLTIVIAADSVTEGGVTTATIARNGDTSAAVTVTLFSDDTTEATIPTTVTIEAGQTTSPSVTILAVDDTDIDGTQTATITASATGLTSGSDSLDVTDNDVAPRNQQNISSESASRSAIPGGTLSVPVIYRTLNPDGTPVALQASLISFNLHFDSTALTFVETTDAFAEGIQVVPNTTRSESDATVTGDDNDSATDTVLVASYSDNDLATNLGWPNATVVDGQVLFVAHFTAAAGFTGTQINFSANAVGAVIGASEDFEFSSESVVVSLNENLGDVDGDDDFDANDAFLIQLVQLAGSNTQIDQSKGASTRTAAEIRSDITAIGLGGDVDGDSDFDANDSFLIQLVKLAGSNTQIDQSKGASPLSATQIRANVNGLGGNASGQQVSASTSPRLAVVYAEPEFADVDLFATPTQATSDYPATSVDLSESNEVWEGFRSWIDAL